MKNKEYLNEERYQQSNGKVKKVGKLLLIIGVITLVVGFILFIVGFMGFGSNVVNGIHNTSDSMFGNFGAFAMGGIILTLGFGMTIAGGFLMLLAHRREITAYGVQQVMPIAQEGIEKMAPSVGSAIGTIGKELAKGIKEGINEAEKNDSKEK